MRKETCIPPGPLSTFHEDNVKKDSIKLNSLQELLHKFPQVRLWEVKLTRADVIPAGLQRRSQQAMGSFLLSDADLRIPNSCPI